MSLVNAKIREGAEVERARRRVEKQTTRNTVIRPI
jgi:hypothetical protein